MDATPPPARPASRADLAAALAWIVLGTGMLYGGWSMDRLEAQNINPYTAPGLVPALLGAGLVILGALLFLRSVRATAGGPSTIPTAEGTSTALASGRFPVALALCLLYGAGLVGRGVPFWLATFVFVFAAIAIFQWPARRAEGRAVRGLVVAALCGAGTALAVSLVFQELFLVRLP